MPDLESFRQRVEQAEARLKAVHAARERESAALVDMWRQIRTRFTKQEEEIARVRALANALDDKNNALQEMVENLLGTIENNIRKTGNETVPRITGMAQELLEAASGEPAYAALRGQEARETPPAAAPSRHDAPLAAADVAALLVDEDAVQIDVPPGPGAATADDAVLDLDRIAPPGERTEGEEGVSPGLRSLINRVQRAMNKPGTDEAAAKQAERGQADEELARDARDRIAPPGAERSPRTDRRHRAPLTLRASGTGGTGGLSRPAPDRYHDAFQLGIEAPRGAVWEAG
ncbi:MAG: hypothetical protein FJX67_10170 [Alphaproteobacteria bacterium]|nr:hypothetical protein [Alphaproteobacteria bacterium]